MPLPLRWDSRTCMCSNLSRDRIRSKPTMIFKPPWEPYNERIKQGEGKGRKRIKRENWLCETASLCKQAKWPMVILDRSRWLEDFGETRNFWTRFRPRDWEAILRLSEEKDLVYKFEYGSSAYQIIVMPVEWSVFLFPFAFTNNACGQSVPESCRTCSMRNNFETPKNTIGIMNRWGARASTFKLAGLMDI